MESKNIIFGSLALAVVGGGAYFFLKNKRLKDASKLAELEKLGQGVNIGVATAGSSTTPDKVLGSAPISTPSTQEETNKQIQAQGLANQIAILKSEWNTLQEKYERCSFDSKPNTGANKGSTENYKNCSNTQTMMLEKRKQITLLGYKEDNGLAVKI